MPPDVPLNMLLARHHSFSPYLWKLPALAEGRSLQQMLAVGRAATPTLPLVTPWNHMGPCVLQGEFLRFAGSEIGGFFLLSSTLQAGCSFVQLQIAPRISSQPWPAVILHQLPDPTDKVLPYAAQDSGG